MTEITKPFLPVVNQPAINRNKEHWPTAVNSFVAAGYGGEHIRKEAERKHAGDEHAPPHYCYQLAKQWCEQIDAHESAYFMMPRQTFRDSAIDRSAKDLPPPTPRKK